MGLRLLPYEQQTRSTGVVRKLLDLLELTELCPATGNVRINLTLGCAAIAAARTCMDRLRERGIVLSELQRNRANIALREENSKFDSPSFWGLMPAAARRIRDQYWGDNELLARTQWDKPWDTFFPCPSRDPQSNIVMREAPGAAHYDT